MKRHHLTAGLLLILTAFFSCKDTEVEQVKKPVTFDELALSMEIGQMFDDYHAAIAEKGLTGEIGFLDTTEQFFWVPPGYFYPLRYKDVKRVLTKSAPKFSSVKFEWDSLKIIPLSADVATYTGIVSGTMTDTSGNSTDVSVIESGTLIKRADGWKLLSGQSAIVPQNKDQ